MARSDEGMSSSTKVLLAVLGGGGLLALVCCGGVAWVANRAWQNFQQTIQESIAQVEEMDEVYIDDPDQIAALTATIVGIDIPARYEPYLGEDHTSVEVLRKQVHYGSNDDLGGIVIREMLAADVTTREEAARVLAGEVTEEGWFYEFEPASTEQRTFTINGEECTFEFRAGKDPDSGDDLRAVVGTVPSGGGVAYLAIYDTAANWDEAAIVSMIESIRMGQPAAAAETAPAVSSPDAATPTDIPVEAPSATPAESPPETPGTPDGGTTSPQGTQEPEEA
jgi:hypothetical protein